MTNPAPINGTSTALAPAAAPPPSALAPAGVLGREQIDLLKRTVASGTTDLQFSLFLEVVKATGLNPFQKQIYAVVRNSWNPATKQKEPTMTVQTGIDGYRLIASRTGQHIGTDDAEYGPDATTKALVHPTWARVTVTRLVGGHLAKFTATARWSEYVQTDAAGNPSNLWAKMPYLMLAKCAEALALRKAFPAELSGVYTKEEMGQADNGVAETAPAATPAPAPQRKAAPAPAPAAKAPAPKASAPAVRPAPAPVPPPMPEPPPEAYVDGPSQSFGEPTGVIDAEVVEEPAPAERKPGCDDDEGELPFGEEDAPGLCVEAAYVAKRGTNSKGEWALWVVKFSDGSEGTTFSASVGKKADSLAQTGKKVRVDFAPAKSGKGLEVVSVEEV